VVNVTLTINNRIIGLHLVQEGGLACHILDDNPAGTKERFLRHLFSCASIGNKT